MRQGCTRCVGYVPGRTLQAMNKCGRAKFHIHEAKLYICSAWFLIRPRSVVVELEFCVLILGCLFSSLQNVSGQQIF